MRQQLQGEGVLSLHWSKCIFSPSTQLLHFTAFSSTVSLVGASHGYWFGQVSVVSTAAAASLWAIWGSARKLAAWGIFRHHQWCTKVPQWLQQHRRGGVFPQCLCQLELQHQHNRPQLKASGKTSAVSSSQDNLVGNFFSHADISLSTVHHSCQY